jgi:hypothetical protein
MNKQTRISHKVLPLLAIIALSISSVAAAAPAAAGNGFSADVAVSDIYPGNQPHGQFWVRITNHGPGNMHNVHVDIVCGYDTQDLNTGKKGPSQQRHFGANLNLSPGQTQALATGLNLDTNVYSYQVGCQVNVGFNDPNMGNNFYSEYLKGMSGGGKPGNSGSNGGQFSADVAVTDIYPGNQPHGQFFVRIVNHGPGTLKNVKLNISCSSHPTRKQGFGAFISDHQSFQVTLNLNPGQQQAFATGLTLDTNVYTYFVDCVAKPGFQDPNAGNNNYNENFQ